MNAAREYLDMIGGANGLKEKAMDRPAPPPAEAGEPGSIPEILSAMLDLVEPVASWHDLAGISGADDDKILLKHRMVLVVEYILDLTQTNGWGLCQNDGAVYLYNGRYWDKLDGDVLRNVLGEVAEKMGVTKLEARTYDFRDKLYKQFLTTAHLETAAPTKGAVLINLGNGTLEITPTGVRLREFRREDFLTHILLFDYDPAAEARVSGVFKRGAAGCRKAARAGRIPGVCVCPAHPPEAGKGVDFIRKRGKRKVRMLRRAGIALWPGQRNHLLPGKPYRPQW